MLIPDSDSGSKSDATSSPSETSQRFQGGHPRTSTPSPDFKPLHLTDRLESTNPAIIDAPIATIVPPPDFTERFKYLICSSGLLEASPRTGNVSSRDVVDTKSGFHQSSAASIVSQRPDVDPSKLGVEAKPQRPSLRSEVSEIETIYYTPDNSPSWTTAPLPVDSDDTAVTLTNSLPTEPLNPVEPAWSGAHNALFLKSQLWPLVNFSWLHIHLKNQLVYLLCEVCVVAYFVYFCLVNIRTVIFKGNSKKLISEAQTQAQQIRSSCDSVDARTTEDPANNSDTIPEQDTPIADDGKDLDQTIKPQVAEGTSLQSSALDVLGDVIIINDKFNENVQSAFEVLSQTMW